MKVVCNTVGMVQTNCYFLLNEESKEALIVDPAEQGSMLYQKCKDLGYQPVAVLLTHGHFDHIMGLGSLRRVAKEEQGEESLPVYVYEDDATLMQNSNRNLAMGFGFGDYTAKADLTVKDGDCLTLAGLTCQVIHTPGHTPGSCCYYFEKEGVLISGDTLFHLSVGRTDFPGGSTSALVRSIIEKLFVLPEDTIVYPGHNDPTSIAIEKQYNPVADMI